MASARPLSRIPTFSQKKISKREVGAPTDATNNEVTIKRRRLELGENVPPMVNRDFKAKARLRRSQSMSSLHASLAASSNLRNKNVKPTSGFGTSLVRKTSNPRLATSTVTQPTSTVAAAPPTGVKVGTKRPGWDLRGQIQDLQAKLVEERSLKSKNVEHIRSVEDKYNTATARNQQVETLLANKELTIKNITQVLNQKETELADTLEALRSAQAKIVLLESEKQLYQSEISSNNCIIDSLKTTVTSLQGRKFELEEEFKQLLEKHGSLKGKTASLESQVLSLSQTVAQQLEQLRHGEKMRRQMHNMIQDLKGTIRVFCRVRPLLKKEEDLNPIGCLGFPDTEGRTVVLTQGSKDPSLLNESNVSTCSGNNGNHNGNHNKSHEFSFDRVFNPSATQSEVFHEISQLVQSALDGYNVCIFAYGPTGSGKTYTMEGGAFADPTDPLAGMIPRGVEQVFESVRVLAQQGWQYEIDASFLEIYNETIRDLLTTKSDKKCDIKLGKENEVYVSNLTNIAVIDSERVYELLAKAQKNRAVAETNCNERSSRSHSVFILHIRGSNTVTGETCKGTLNLVDLAGSERLKSSGSEGERLREAKNINKSLSNLGSVILALGQKADHIPYRNSKLTFLLMNSLGGNSKTLMFINVSPSDDHYYETLNSLRFAKAVNECYVGVAQKRK